MTINLAPSMDFCLGALGGRGDLEQMAVMAESPKASASVGLSSSGVRSVEVTACRQPC